MTARRHQAILPNEGTNEATLEAGYVYGRQAKTEDGHVRLFSPDRANRRRNGDHRLSLGCPVWEYAARLSQVAGLEIISVDTALWLDSLGLDWPHRDPVDRLIVSLAKRRQLGLVTADDVIRVWYPHVIW